MTTVLIIILLLIALGALPNFGYTTSYGASSTLGIIAIILLILALMGRI